MTQLVVASSHVSKGCRFHPHSGHIPKLWVQSLVEACTRGNQLMFPFHINVSFSLSLSLPSISLRPLLSLSLLSPLSKINKYILEWLLKKIKIYLKVNKVSSETNEKYHLVQDMFDCSQEVKKGEGTNKISWNGSRVLLEIEGKH